MFQSFTWLFVYSVTAEKWVPIIEVPVDSIKTYLQKKKREGFSILGLEQTANSVPLDQYIFPKKMVSCVSNSYLPVILIIVRLGAHISKRHLNNSQISSQHHFLDLFYCGSSLPLGFSSPRFFWLSLCRVVHFKKKEMIILNENS